VEGARGFVLAVLLASSPPAHAESNSVVQGVVRDEGSGALSGVTVGLRALAGGLDRSVTTDTDGAFAVPGLPPGRYRLDLRPLALRPRYGRSISSSRRPPGWR
jgi:hypothetical protein